MKNIKINNIKNTFLIAIVLLMNVSCERDMYDDAALSTFSKNGDVFIDTFSAGLGYGAFGGSNYTAFTVDTEVKYQGSASMRFDVPSEGDPRGAYAGGVFIDGSGRNLTDYDALTFWVKGSQAATINEVGFGTDFGLNKYNVKMQNVPIDTNWKKIIIPIPDASKLIQEKGMFWYSEGAENGLGYTFWIDNVKYEKLGTIAHTQPKIWNGLPSSQDTYIGIPINLTLSETFNMPNGFNQTLLISPSYYTFTSSDPSVAKVSELGVVSVLATGTTVISATIAGVNAIDTITLTSLGAFPAATIPSVNPSNVISIFSNAYTNVPVDNNRYNNYWAPYQTTQGGDYNNNTIIQINKGLPNQDDIIKYSQFNFVGIQFSQPNIDASAMTYVHVDLKVLNTSGIRNSMKIKLVDFGSDGIYGGGNDSSHEYTYTNANLASGNWISVELPLSSFTGLTSKAHLGQFILGPASSGITDLLVDNIYFHN